VLKISFKNKILVASLFFSLLGGASLALEHTFYQYIDVEGWLHESLFLPFGFFSLLIGAFGLSISALIRIFLLIKPKLSAQSKLFTI
jgi:hypothetical protein